MIWRSLSRLLSRLLSRFLSRFLSILLSGLLSRLLSRLLSSLKRFCSPNGGRRQGHRLTIWSFISDLILNQVLLWEEQACLGDAREREVQLAPAAARDKRQATSDKRQALWVFVEAALLQMSPLAPSFKYWSECLCKGKYKKYKNKFQSEPDGPCWVWGRGRCWDSQLESHNEGGVKGDPDANQMVRHLSVENSLGRMGKFLRRTLDCLRILKM